MTPHFSIIIPVLNGEKYLPECFEKIKNQVFKNFEVVVINDGSTDSTRELAEAFAAAVSFPVKIHSWDNHGTYASMNKAIELAAGDWLYFTGCDDRLIDENVLQDVFEASQNTNDVLIYGDVILKSTNKAYDKAFTLHRLLFERNICHQAMFYHHTVFGLIGDYNTDYTIWADWDLNIRLFKQNRLRTKYIERIIAIYNDLSGISAVWDPIFRKELPVTIIADFNSSIHHLTSKPSFKMGKRFFSWLDRFQK